MRSPVLCILPKFVVYPARIERFEGRPIRAMTSPGPMGQKGVIERFTEEPLLMARLPIASGHIVMIV